MTEKEFVQKINSKNGKVYIVGGYVRDKIMGRIPKDKDYVICGISEEDFLELFNDAKKVGESFPVYLLEIDGKTCEVAFARKERKIKEGYKGFSVEFDKNVTIEEDLFRRDTTMNSIAIELPSECLIDPYKGRNDIGMHLIVPTSKHFLEDPVRALRAARQSAELQFSITMDVLVMMHQVKEELQKEPSERIFKEMEKALKSSRPSIFFNSLSLGSLLDVTFPEIDDLIKVKQPREFHPEGDAYIHSLMILDLVSYRTKNPITRFAALVHDIGKGLTPKEELPHHYKHDLLGLDVLENWNSRMTLPNSWMKMAKFVIRNHMRAVNVTHPGKMVDLLMEIDSLKIDLKEFNLIIEADAGFVPEHLKYGETLIFLLKYVDGEKAPEELKGKEIGEWIRQTRITLFREFFKIKNSSSQQDKNDFLSKLILTYKDKYLKETVLEENISEEKKKFFKSVENEF